ncbi:hypothetical protein [Vibrio tetraodonis]|uniref:hypothetical protein n=1 Tax=Vibrio tetraodonis TaxID=2231647 RepID=UPI000E0B159C|nr:hypothetical protein [Vibrio tetraodonis]
MSVQCKASMGDDTKKLLSEFQHEVGMFREGYNYMDHPELSLRIARSYMDNYPEFYFLDGWGTPLGINNECSSMQNKDSKPMHGGKRSGSGRKKGLPTENVRLVSDLADEFKQLSNYYKSCSDDERSELRSTLSDLLHEFG